MSDLVLVRNCWMVPGELELVPELTCLPGGEVQSALSGMTEWVPHDIRTYHFYIQVT